MDEEIPNRLKQARKPTVRDASIKNASQGKKKVRINVGGQIHEPFVSTLKNIPDSPLALILKDNCKEQLDYDEERNELFFDRHPGVFSQVLDYFQTGKLHHPQGICGPMFEEELRFWGIEEQQMETCCWHTYTLHRVTQDHLKALKTQEDEGTQHARDDIELGQHENPPRNSTKYRVWLLLDQPSSSTAAKLYAWLSLAFVVISVVTFTIYSQRGADSNRVEVRNSTVFNQTMRNSTVLNCVGTTNCQSGASITQSLDLWAIFVPLEVACIVWFTTDLIFRAIFCPKFSTFVMKISTFLDVIALAASYILLIVSDQQSNWVGIFNMSRYFRVSRFFRVFYSLQVLGGTLRASAYQFLTLLCLLTIPMILFSSIVYYTEKNWGKEKSRSTMESIPRTFWWAIITMTTVGYGDSTPQSIPGYFVGGAAAILGVIILSLTGSILGSTFEQYYNLAQTQMKIPKNRENKVTVPFESLHDMAGIPLQEISKSSIRSCNTNISGRDSGYGHSPVAKQRIRAASHPPSQGHILKINRTGSHTH